MYAILTLRYKVNQKKMCVIILNICDSTLQMENKMWQKDLSRLLIPITVLQVTTTSFRM